MKPAPIVEFVMARPRLVALVSGVLITAGLPPWGWWPLSFIGLAGWYLAIAHRPARGRFWTSFIVGLGWSIPATLWMFDLTPAGWPVAVLVFSLLAGCVGLLTPPDDGWARRIAFPAALIVTELIRWNYPFGGTPIASYAMIGISTPFWITARLFGSPFLTGVVALAGVTVAEAFHRRWRELSTLVVALSLITLVSFAGGLPVQTEGFLDVAVVQGGGPQNTRADVCTTRAVFERHMAASETIDREVDLVVWPEDVVHPASDGRITPQRCDDDLLRFTEASDRLTQLAADLDAVVVSGWFERTDDGLANANYSIAQSPDGTVTDRYDKVRLVPFGEFVPLRGLIEQFSDEVPGVDVRPGTDQAILETDVGTLGISISWEVFFDHRARDAIGNGGQVLLNPTNGSSYWLTIVQSQQIASSRLRAAETGRYVLQAAPTGFSGIISPDGEVLERTGVSEQRVLYGTIEMRTGRTTAVALGAWPTLVFSLGALGFVWFGRRRSASDLDPQRDRPVVDQLDGHVGPEPSGGDSGAGLT